MRSVADITADIAAESAKQAAHKRICNEGAGGYTDETKIEALTAELRAAQAAESPLATDAGLRAERIWFNAQGFTSAADAHQACMDRGYALCDLQAAAKKVGPLA